jgi:hypothetical protein
MKKMYIISSGISLFLFACTPHLQTYDLADEYAVSMHCEGKSGGNEAIEEEGESLVGVPALAYYGGDLKRGAIWWAGKGIVLEKGDVFVITAFNVGPGNTPFGATFPPIDLIKEDVVLKVSARAEGKDGTVPVLYLQVDDANGYQANAKRPFNKIENSEEFTDYYFDLKDIYLQSDPKKHKVNGALINSLKFFINPGEAGYSGKIFIKEIRVISAKQVER